MKSSAQRKSKTENTQQQDKMEIIVIAIGYIGAAVGIIFLLTH